MTPDRWRRITELFHRVRGRDVVARTALLEEACSDDLAMRADVEELLAADSNAGLFGETPMFTAALEPGAVRAEPACAQFLLRTNASYWSVIRSVPAARELLEKYSKP